MALSKFEKDMNIVAALDDEPNDVGGLTAAELKAKFDEGGAAVKKFLNDTLIPEIESQKANTSDLQGLVLGQIPDGTITSEKLADGSVTSEKLSQDAIPSSYSKTEILDGSVLGVFSGDEISEDSLPKDILQYLAMALGSMEQDKGVLLVYTSTPEGEPVAGQTVTISGSFGEIPLSGSGSVMVIAEPGSYTVSFDDTGFYETDAAEKTVDVVSGKITVCHFSCSLKSSGTIVIEQSTTLVVPTLFPPVDLFAVGGGASGGIVQASGNFKCASGGAGGYTSTVLGVDLSGKKIKVIIGAGGNPATILSSDTNGVKSGNSGGKTTVKHNDLEIISADGGYRGIGSMNSATGPNGGSAGGGCGNNNSQTTADLSGGSDGSNGNNTKNPEQNGIGQGTTTRAFGDLDGILCSAGGGAVYYNGTNLQVIGNGGLEGGGNGRYSTSRIDGYAGTNYGDGGGAVAGALNSTSGAGHDGVVMIRWGVSV